MAQRRFRSFGAGSVLGRSFTIYMANFVPFTLLALLLMSPVVLIYVFWQPEGMGNEFLAEQVGRAVHQGLILILAGSMTYGVYQRMRGKPASGAECFAVGIRRLASFLVVGVLVAAIVGIGFVALVIPGIVLACTYWVAVPVAVIERSGVGAALYRSQQLTKGERMTIFGILFILGVLSGLSLLALGALLTKSEVITSEIAAASLVLFVIAFFGAWQATAVAVSYHDLRAAKEGVDVETLAAAFE